MLYFLHMILSTTRDLWYLVASICLLGVSGFVMWALYELAHLGRQTNELVQETRKRMSMVEKAVDGLTDQLGEITNLIGSLTSVAQSVFGFFQRKTRRSSLRDEVQRLKDELEDLDA